MDHNCRLFYHPVLHRVPNLLCQCHSHQRPSHQLCATVFFINRYHSMSNLSPARCYSLLYHRGPRFPILHVATPPNGLKIGGMRKLSRIRSVPSLSFTAAPATCMLSGSSPAAFLFRNESTVALSLYCCPHPTKLLSASARTSLRLVPCTFTWKMDCSIRRTLAIAFENLALSFVIIIYSIILSCRSVSLS